MYLSNIQNSKFDTSKSMSCQGHKLCFVFPRLIKTVRLRLSYIQDLIMAKHIKMILLVRDPRGVMKSREKVEWCKYPACSDVSNLCQDLNNDMQAVFKIAQSVPNQIFLLRYIPVIKGRFSYFVINGVTFLVLTINIGYISVADVI
jgi:hypothetical protein